MSGQKEKDAIKSMELAKRNMETVLSRNNQLESTLKKLISDVRSLKKYTPERAYNYGGKSSISALFDEAANKAESTL